MIFSEDQLTNIVKAIDSNNQIYSRIQARPTNSIVVKRIREINPDFDIKQYTHVYL